MTAEVLLAKLNGVLGKGPTYRAICPAHESKNRSRSLAIREADDGRVLVHCHAGCGVQEVLQAVGLEFDALYPPRTDQHFLRPVRKPWRASEVVAALKGELNLAFVLLCAVAAKTPPNDDDAERASVAIDRIAHFLNELEHAC